MDKKIEKEIKMDVPYEILTSKHIVGFFDILGTKKMEDAYVGRLFVLITKLVERFNEIPGLYYNIFSDNILIAVKYEAELSEEEREKNIEAFLKAMCYIIDHTITFTGCFIRGGICVGKLYGDNNFAYGKALIDSVELESNKAIYPRFIIEKSALEEINNEKFSSKFCEDEDGLFFYDFLHECGFNSPSEYVKIGRTVCNLKLNNLIYKILKNAKNNVSDAKVQHKMAWMGKYCNRFIEEYGIDKINCIDLSSLI